MWKWAESAPSGQARLWQPNRPECAKSHAVWQSPSSRTEKSRTFSIFLFFRPFFRVHRGSFCGFRAAGHTLWLTYFLTVLAAPGRLNPTWVPGETLILNRSVLYGTYGHIHRYRGHTHTCSPGRLQGHLWVILAIGSCFCGPLRLMSVSVSGLLPHTRTKTPQNTVF